MSWLDEENARFQGTKNLFWMVTFLIIILGLAVYIIVKD